MITKYHSKYFAHELTKRCSSNSLQKLAGTLLDAQVDLNPHQVDAALFAFQSPLSKGAILADEVGLGKTIEAGMVIYQKCVDDIKTSLEIKLKQLDIEIKTLKTTSKRILDLEKKLELSVRSKLWKRKETKCG